MTKCGHCGHEFHNALLRSECPKCGRSLNRLGDTSRDDDGFDTAGFALGMATGVPLSPTRGISTGSILGAALHDNGPAHATPSPDPAPSYSGGGGDSGGGGSSASYDSGSSSSSDSGSSSSGGGGD